MTSRHAISPLERTLLALVLVVAAALRFAFPAAMAVEHFDEGVYASSSNSFFWFGGDEQFRFTNRSLFAPPLLPWLIKWSINIFGPWQLTPMLPSLVAGAATVALLWWVARSWFGPAAGVAAATLAALSDVHLLYSRTALTDALLCFWLLLAVYLIGEAVRRKRFAWTLAAGLATGLAWWTKYNGWLPIAIALAGVVPWAWITRWPSLTSPVKPALRCLLIGVVAFVVWLPALDDIQKDQPAGYAAVAANHRQFVVGPAGWCDSFCRQWANHRYLDSWLSRLSLPLAILLAFAVARPGESRFTCNGISRFGPIVACLVLVALSTAGGSSAVLGVLALFGIAMQLYPHRPIDSVPPPDDAPASCGRSAPSHADRLLPATLLAAWFSGLLLATPLYHPYSRLTLPWLMSAWLGTAALFSLPRNRKITAEEGQGNREPAAGLRRPVPRSWAFLGITLLIVSAAARWIAPTPSAGAVVAWQSRTSLQRVAAELMHDADRISARHRTPDDAVGSVIYVYAEPGLFYHLGAAGAVVQPTGNLAFASPSARPQIAPTFVATGMHAQTNPALWNLLGLFADRLELVATYPYTPSDLVLMDHAPPKEIAELRPQTVRLYRVR